MKDFTLKQSINDKKDNIRRVSIPFKFLFNEADANDSERRMAVFLGANFRDLPGTDLKEAARISNLCLDYIRRECKGCDFYYKPHPAETDEASFLDLSGFKIESKIVAELFYIKNAQRIKYVFSACSGGNKIAYAMGFNSHLFLNLFDKAFDSKTMKGYREEYFKELPKTCYIDDFGQPLRENRKELPGRDNTLETNIHGLFLKKNGNIWILLGDPAYLADVITLSIIIKKIDSKRAVNLIVNRHHRWDIIPESAISGYFNQIFFFPRIFYSLRPGKIIRAFKTAREIKKFPIQPDDILFEFEGLSFLDNCFSSYFKSNLKVAMLSPDTYNICFGQKFISRSIFRTRPGAKFFNMVLEPFLRLECSQWFEDKRRINNVCGYFRPLNDIFDYVWIFK